MIEINVLENGKGELKLDPKKCRKKERKQTSILPKGLSVCVERIVME